MGEALSGSALGTKPCAILAAHQFHSRKDEQQMQPKMEKYPASNEQKPNLQSHLYYNAIG
eukprot:2769347-Amphidinium_carterae.1